MCTVQCAPRKFPCRTVLYRTYVSRIVALLSVEQVLCLDECTANVDPATGDKVLNIVRGLSSPHENKGERAHAAVGTMTVLSIAHRVRTILAFKRVLVVEKGRVVEDGNPQRLLEQEGSVFRGLAAC